MIVQETGRNVTKARLAFATIAALLHLTSYRYPIAETVTDGATFDYVIVGAGTAGSIVANRLTEDPTISVLVIEAGDDPSLVTEMPFLATFASKTRYDWNYTSQRSSAFQCVQNDQLQMHQGKALGGSSSINDMYYVRGHPSNYDRWAEITGDQSWSYNDLLSYFKKSERLEVPSILNSADSKYHGTEGYIGVTQPESNMTNKYLDSLKELGYNILVDINSANNIGFGPSVLTIANGIRQSTANTFLAVAKDRPNLHVMKESPAQKILIDENKRATGVVVTDENTGKTITVRANKEVVLSAGSISNPRLLMLSGIGPKQKLQQSNIKVIANLPVGELQSHTPVVLIVKTSKPSGKSQPFNPQILPLPVAIGFTALNASQNYPDYQATIVGVNGESMIPLCSELYNFKDDVCQYFYDQIKDNEALYIILWNSDSKQKGNINLNANNPEYPSIDMHEFPDKSDLEKYKSYAEDILRVVDTTYFKNAGAEFVPLPNCKSFAEGSLDFWNCYLRCMSSTSMHYTSTCAMGSVVDSRLRVIGVKDLRIVDASVMPSITIGNTQAPSIVIGEKGADLIKEDYYYKNKN